MADYWNALLPGNFIGHNMAAPRISGSAGTAVFFDYYSLDETRFI